MLLLGCESLQSSCSGSHPSPLKIYVFSGHMRVIGTSHRPGCRNKPWQRHRCDGPRPPCSRSHQFFSLLQVFYGVRRRRKKTGVSPSITSYISVSNLMPRCEWILKQAKKPPAPAAGRACTRPPGRPAAAGLNKYVAEGTCWQLGPRYAAAVCVVASRGRRGENSWLGTPRFLGEQEKEG